MPGVPGIQVLRQLRADRHTLPVLVLSPSRGDARRLVEHRLTPVVHAAYALDDLEEAASQAERAVDVHIKVDTGMGRYGFFPEEALEVARRIHASDHLRLEGVMTHFAAAEDPAQDDFTRAQIARFDDVLTQLTRENIPVPIRHASATVNRASASSRTAERAWGTFHLRARDSAR